MWVYKVKLSRSELFRRQPLSLCTYHVLEPEFALRQLSSQVASFLLLQLRASLQAAPAGESATAQGSHTVCLLRPLLSSWVMRVSDIPHSCGF